MKTWKKVTIKAAAFLLIFAVLFLGFQEVLRYKWRDDGYMQAKMDLCKYADPGIDVLYLGSSPLYAGIAPMILWKEQGITGFNFGVSSQNALCMYYLAKEILEYQTPEWIVLDFYDFTNTRNVEAGSGYEAAHLKTLEVMSRPNKADMLRDILATNEHQSLVDYLFPLLRYHTRWTELTKNDFEYDPDYGDYLKGMYLSREVVEVVPNQMYYSVDGNKNAKASDFALTYYRKIVEMCREKGVQVAALTLPNAYIPSDFKYALIQEFCDEYAMPYLNYNTEEWRERLGIRYDEDFYDEGHMNLNGSIKMSRELARRFHEEFGLTDHRGDAAYASWDEDWDVFSMYYGEILQRQGY